MKFANQIKACAGILTLSLLAFPLTSWAVTVDSVPNPRQINGTWVTDMANILTPETEAEINRQIGELEAKNGTEIAVVTVPNTSPSASAKEFATTLFNRWGIGKKGVNNGVLFLISRGERRVEIETGNGVRKILPDKKVAQIVQKVILPSFKRGNFDGGTLSGTKALIVKLDDSTAPDKIDDGFWKTVWLAIYIGSGIGALAVVIRCFVILKKQKQSNKNQNRNLLVAKKHRKLPKNQHCNNHQINTGYIDNSSSIWISDSSSSDNSSSIWISDSSSSDNSSSSWSSDSSSSDNSSSSWSSDSSSSDNSSSSWSSDSS
ncbi:YgcG family protein, partial [Aerosakkonemataceae cyanobacterium BLCC-F50]